MEPSNNIEPLTIELCYQILADYLIGNAGNDEWDTFVLESEIYDSMTTASAYKIYANEKECLGFEYCNKRNKATLFRRDNILESTGERVWGLNFTLEKDGRTKINYNYDKPDNYLG